MKIIKLILSFCFIFFFLNGCSPNYFDLTKSADSPEMIGSYENFINLNPNSDDAFVAIQRIAEPYIVRKEFNEAIRIINKYKDQVGDKTCINKLIAVLEKKDKTLKLQNLKTNTNESEYCPVPTADGKKLYYCKFSNVNGFGGEDIYVSENKNSEWQSPINLGNNINTKSHESPISISTDGNILILFGNYSGSFGRGDLFYSEINSLSQQSVQHFPEPINTDYFESDGTFSSDGKSFIFVSDRPGGIGDYHPKDKYFHGSNWGNTDIYVCIKNDNGWSEPINLGPTINSPFAERTPFLHPDGKTLYFSSEGHCGIGRLDVYKSTRLKEDSWTEWSEPINLGREINSVGDEWGYKISTNGEIAYFAKDNSSNKNDLYSIELPAGAKPNPVATIHGKITDLAGNPVEVTIKVEDLTSGKSAAVLKSNPKDGSYFMVLPLGKNYGYFLEKKGYFPSSQNIDLTKEKKSKDIQEDFVMISIEDSKNSDAPIRINNIFFETDQATILNESSSELNRLASIIQSVPGIKIEISGHTDNTGTSAYNQDLSKRRAQAVVTYLISKGCDKNGLFSKGFGDKNPVAPNNTAEGKAKNRRVEFRILR